MELQRGDILDIVFSCHYFRRDDHIGYVTAVVGNFAEIYLFQYGTYWFEVDNHTLTEAHCLPGGQLIPYAYEVKYAKRARYEKAGTDYRLTSQNKGV